MPRKCLENGISVHFSRFPGHFPPIFQVRPKSILRPLSYRSISAWRPEMDLYEVHGIAISDSFPESLRTSLSSIWFAGTTPDAVGNQHLSLNCRKILCNFEPRLWLEIITSRDAQSACFKGSRTSCDVAIFWAFFIFVPFCGPKKIASRDGCFLLMLAISHSQLSFFCLQLRFGIFLHTVGVLFTYNRQLSCFQSKLLCLQWEGASNKHLNGR